MQIFSDKSFIEDSEIVFHTEEFFSCFDVILLQSLLEFVQSFLSIQRLILYHYFLLVYLDERPGQHSAILPFVIQSHTMEKHLEVSQRNVHHWESVKENHLSLLNYLSELEKSNGSLMVMDHGLSLKIPFNNLAMIPVQMDQNHNIQMSIGNGYFASMSILNAIQVAKRRMICNNLFHFMFSRHRGPAGKSRIYLKQC